MNMGGIYYQHLDQSMEHIISGLMISVHMPEVLF